MAAAPTEGTDHTRAHAGALSPSPSLSSRARVPLRQSLSLSAHTAHTHTYRRTHHVPSQTFFTLACNSDTYAACHGGDHPGGMLDVRVGAWGGLAEGGSAAADAAELKSALSTASAALAASAPKKGWAARKAAAAKAKGGVGAADEAATSTPPAPDPARPAVRALAYRMPPDWGDGWMTKRE